MEFEWDEAKRRANVEKHRLDFTQASLILDQPHVQVRSRHEGQEDRWLAIGDIDGRLVTVVFTMRGAICRVISVRRAARAERRIYEEVYG